MFFFGFASRPPHCLCDLPRRPETFVRLYDVFRSRPRAHHAELLLFWVKKLTYFGKGVVDMERKKERNRNRER
jgi:hypothetical protein